MVLRGFFLISVISLVYSYTLNTRPRAIGTEFQGLRCQSTNRPRDSLFLLKSVDKPVELLATEPGTALRAVYGAVGLHLHIIFNIAPGGSAEARAMDLELAKKMITTPLDGAGSPIFFAVFNSLGCYQLYMVHSYYLEVSRTSSPR